MEKWLGRLAGSLVVSNEVAYFATVLKYISNTRSFWSRLFSNFTLLRSKDCTINFAMYRETYRYSL